MDLDPQAHDGLRQGPSRRNQQQQPASIYLTQEEIKKFFPAQTFANLKTAFPKSTCSVCLDEFQSNTLCHQLYCEHIFHEVCIQMWLAKHDSCPECRKPMTKDAVKEYFKNLKNGKKPTQLVRNKEIQIEVYNDRGHDEEEVPNEGGVQRPTNLNDEEKALVE